MTRDVENYLLRYKSWLCEVNKVAEANNLDREIIVTALRLPNLRDFRELSSWAEFSAFMTTYSIGREGNRCK